jgi:hypothetical protein
VGDSLRSIPLRDGWMDVIRILEAKNVPTYIFSEGLGDLCGFVMMHNGMERGLPSTVKIISNFFRTTPDGYVRAFSSPIIHAANKNATSASRVMEVPPSDRPNAILLTDSDAGLSMTDGALVLQSRNSPAQYCGALLRFKDQLLHLHRVSGSHRRSRTQTPSIPRAVRCGDHRCDALTINVSSWIAMHSLEVLLHLVAIALQVTVAYATRSSCCLRCLDTD